MEKINIGFIGCGRISDLHYFGYSLIPEARVKAVCDTDYSKAEEKKLGWGAAKAYRDYRDLLADPDIDAVEILSPQLLHEEMVLEAVDRKKHIALQKPMTINLESAQRILSALPGDRVFKVSDNYLFYPPIVKASELIQAGEIGEPTNIRIKMISGGGGGWAVPDSAWAWRKREMEEGRGMQTFDHGHHLWALSIYLLGDVEKVCSWIDSVDGTIDSPAVIMWKHAKGVRYGTCEYAHASELEIPSKYYSNDEWIEITGTGGIILINRCTGELRQDPPLSLFNRRGWTYFKELPSDWSLGFHGSCKNFIRAIQGKEAPSLSGEEATKVLTFDLAIADSAREGKTVFL